MDGNLQHIIIPAKLNTAAPDTNTLTFLILENTMGPVIEPIQFPNVNIDANLPMNYNEYISCDSFRIRLNWLPFQEYGIWRYTVPLAAVGEKSCVSHSIAEEIDGIHPEW